MSQSLSRRHLLAAVVPGVAAGLLCDTNAADAQERVLLRGRFGHFYAEGERPAENGKKPGVDIKTQRYEDLTAAEMVSMTVGIPLQPKEPNQATRIMQLSLDLEHFISVIPIDPKQVEQEDKDEIRKLRDQLTALSGIKVLLHLFNER